MHHFKAKGGTVFSFNSDLSGGVRVGSGDPDGLPLPTWDNPWRCEIPAADLLEFVDWWRREYQQASNVSGTLEDRVSDLEEQVSVIRGHLVL